MTGMTGRCRRHHQNDCHGVATKGLCTKHRRIWKAMKADWDRRANDAEAARKAIEKLDPKRPWTEDELNILRTHSRVEATLLLKRSGKAIGNQRQRLGLTRALWTLGQEQILRDHADEEAARLIGKPVSATRARRSNNGIPGPDANLGVTRARKSQTIRNTTSTKAA